ncbi:MAG: glycosyltransferase [Bacteroidia bacterium]|nr:glycosyltransferase [Bacteroidia bacterium]
MIIVCFGPGPQFKGGISNYNTSLAKALDNLGAEVHIVSWTQQYPAIIPRDFIDRSSKNNLLEGTNIKVTYITNYNNPLTWNETVNYIKSLQPDKVIFQWAIALQGLPLGWMARKLLRWGKSEIIFDCHLVVQKETSSIDKSFSRYGLKKADTYIAHAYKTVEELKETFPAKEFFVNETGERSTGKRSTVIKLYHPIYDLFKPDANFNIEAEKKELHLKKNVFLFFGFIRKYKGLHNVIRAFKLVAEKRNDVSLLIAGESFWNTMDEKKLSTKIKKKLFSFFKSLLLPSSSNEQNYRPLELVNELKLHDSVTVVNRFIPNEEVNKYFQVSDCIVLYYETATPSGIESISYNFELPAVATRVGHFPETIKDAFNGYLAEPENIQSMADVMLKFLERPLPRENVSASTKQMSWENYASAIMHSKK